ncbi:hypothetical protein DL239_21130 [Sedimentitalea sp. CY04]|uniref:Uncharacterized protein n=1 Tax=Parasedimentitalea denitrificans TaxID=2211118 RepID=A0ABX0WFA0_9RHOB|nr:hypothetical protein [Sedimentitalea sp. CY04]
MLVNLWTIGKVASHLGFYQDALLAKASEYNLAIKCGSRSKIRDDEIEKSVDVCRVDPKAPSSTRAREQTVPQPTSSKTKEGLRSGPARAAAAKLKRSTPSASKGNSGQVIPLQRAK